MWIQVTQTDIDNGERGDPCRCPLALAVARILDLPQGKVAVDPYTVDADGDSFYLPSQATQFVTRYDLKLHVEPFTFELKG